jgi:hypothetical protein
LAVQDVVKTMFAAGFDRMKIHSQLVEDGKVTMSYPTFCYQYKQQSSASNNGAAAVPTPARRPETSGQKKADKSAPFSINNKPKLEDFQ